MNSTLKIAFFLIFSSCGTMRDVQLYEPSPNPASPLDLFPYKSIFTDSKQTGVWGMNPNPCKVLFFDTINSFSGKDHLYVKWDDKENCKYIGFGFKWADFKSKNLKPIIHSSAIEFMIRLDSGELTKIPMFFSLLDYGGNHCFSKINILDVQGGKIDTSWTKVLIPLSTFNFQKKAVNLSNIKELRVELQKSGAVHIDNMKIVPHAHNYKIEDKSFSAAFNTLPISIGTQKKYWWGVNQNYSDNFKFITHSSFRPAAKIISNDSITHLPELELSLSLSVNYNKSELDYKWNNFGFPLNKWEYADFSNSYSAAAIKFSLRANELPKIRVSIVSFSGKTRRIHKILDESNIKLISNNYYEVYLPLKAFNNYELLNWATLKEVRFKVLENAQFDIGEFSIIEFRGNPKKPTKWIGI